MGEANNGSVEANTEGGGSASRSRSGENKSRRNGKKFWRKKKKMQSNQTAKIKGATPELKGYYIATHEEVPGKAEMMYKNFKEALERYALKTFSYPQDLADFFENGIRPVLKELDEPKSKSKTAQAILNIEIKNFVKRSNILEENLVKLCSIELGQASMGIKAFVEESTVFKTVHKNKDIIALDKLIQKNVYNFGVSKHPSYSALGIRLKLYTHKQKDGQLVTDYIKELKALHDVALTVDGPQRIGKEGEARVEMERLYKASTGDAKSNDKVTSDVDQPEQVEESS